MKLGNDTWINADFQARIEPPLISLIREVTEQVAEWNIINIKMHQDTVLATSDTDKLNVPMVKNGKHKEFLQMMKDFKTATDGTGTPSATGIVHFPHNMLRGEALRELKILVGQIGSTT